MGFLVLRSDGAPACEPAAPPGYQFELWRPGLLDVIPPGASARTYTAFWLMHWGQAFANRDYSAVVGWNEGKAVHRLGIFPGWFRFPFMAKRDLQIGDVWTDPGHRGRGIAAHAISLALLHHQTAPTRTFWYVVDESNEASIRAAERAGFRPWAKARRTSRFGLGALGRFEVTAGAAGGSA